VDDGVGDVGFSAVLQLGEEFAVEVVEVICGGFVVRVEAGGDVTECGDAQGVGKGFEFGVFVGFEEEMFCETDVVGEHLDVAFATDVLEGEPDFEGAEASGVLRAEVEVVDGFGAKVIVGRVVGEGIA